MTVLQMLDLREQVLKVLDEAKKPLRTPEIEARLKMKGYWTADTFDVRDTVSELISADKVEFVQPGYLVRLTAK